MSEMFCNPPRPRPVKPDEITVSLTADQARAVAFFLPSRHGEITGDVPELTADLIAAKHAVRAALERSKHGGA